jgi:arabinosaccharide transport system permease protein
MPWLFIAPFLILFLIFKALPILYAAFLSLHQMQGLIGGEFVGLDNYFKILKDQEFYQALFNNTKYMIGTMLTLIPLPLVLAVLIDSKFCRGKNFYKVILFIPALVSLVIAAAIFRILLNDSGTAFLNKLLALVGVRPQKWLINPLLTIPSIILIATWRWTGVNIIYFLTGLTGINNYLYEAAEIDGANLWQKFFWITIPLLKPIIVFVATLNLIGGYQLFTEVYVLWNGGNSPGQSALTLAIKLYQTAFSYFRMGYAATIGFVMAFIILAFSLLQLKLTGFFAEDN